MHLDIFLYAARCLILKRNDNSAVAVVQYAIGMPTVFETQPQQQPTVKQPEIADQPILRPPVAGLHHDRMTLFTAFAENPEGVRFETQQDEEKVIIFMREHFSFNVPWILTTLLLLAAPFGVIPFILKFITILPAIPPKYYLVGILFWYEGTFGYSIFKSLNVFSGLEIVRL